MCLGDLGGRNHTASIPINPTSIPRCSATYIHRHGAIQTGGIWKCSQEESYQATGLVPFQNVVAFSSKTLPE